ncbi:MAG: hypothetical protein LAO23_04535 [Acidobacteriia bacterium]|jgi:hypothetical protein|nr:hypothetical protein [Terriglobia bacterium]
MPLSRFAPPKHSRSKLAEALATFGNIKANHKHWMNFSPSTPSRDQVLHPHPVYSVRLSRLLEGRPLSATLKKVGWMYFLQDRGTTLACAEVSIVSGKHKNARLSEGPFVKKALQLIEKSVRDPRIGRRRYAMRSLRLESMHIFCLWLRVGHRVEYFIPVTSSSAVLREGEWLSRREFTKALRSEGQRICTAQERMSRLLEAHRS